MPIINICRTRRENLNTINMLKNAELILDSNHTKLMTFEQTIMNH